MRRCNQSGFSLTSLKVLLVVKVLVDLPDPGTRVLIGGLYREWSDLALETTAMVKVRE
jgi:hypothetical protein